MRHRISLDLQTEGRTAAAWWAGLDGSVALEAIEGRIVGWGFWQQLQAAHEALRNMFSGYVAALPQQFNAEQGTAFTQLDTRVEIEQGQAQLKQFDLIATGLQITAEPNAYVDLVNKQIHLELQADLQEKALTTAEQALVSYAAAPLFIRLSGPWSTPVFSWQWQRLAHTEVKEAIDNGFLEMLGKPDLGAIIKASEPMP